LKYKIAITGGLIGVLLISVLLLFMGATRASHAQAVLKGVKFMGVDLSGLDREAGLGKLAAVEKDFLSSPVYLEYQGNAWQVSPASLGASLDREGIMGKALKVGKEGSLLENWRAVKQVQEEGAEISPVIRVDRKAFSDKLDELVSDLIVLPQNADFRVTKNDTVEIIPGHEGILVDEDKAMAGLVSVLENNQVIPRVGLTLKKVEPDITTEELQDYGLDTLLASYTTRFDSSVTDRAFNVRVAASALDDLLVPPGADISFNKVVGPRSSEAGYKTAKVIVNNELVDGLGGGVCQVSTTLYNAVLLSGLEVVSRSNHSLPVAYVPAGRDATVAYDSIDFVFKNSTDRHIYVKSLIYGNNVTVKIYGNSAYKKNISIKTETVETFDYKVVYEDDPTLPQGTQKIKRPGVKGSRITARRIVQENGVTMADTLPPSLYHPLNELVLVGKGSGEAPVHHPGEQRPADSQNGAGEKPGADSSPGVENAAGGSAQELPPGGGIVPPPMEDNEI
jgi:vancomycin resistance protein YoaR